MIPRSVHNGHWEDSIASNSLAVVPSATYIRYDTDYRTITKHQAALFVFVSQKNNAPVARTREIINNDITSLYNTCEEYIHVVIKGADGLD